MGRLFEGGAYFGFQLFWPQTNIVFISTKHNIQQILKSLTVGKCLVSLKDAAVISFGKCLMLFLRQDSSFGLSVALIRRGGGGGALISRRVLIRAFMVLEKKNENEGL